MSFEKPEKFAEGVRFLLWGEPASGKSPFALSFPKQALIDADSGTSFHDDSNVIVKTNTLVFKELNEDLDELEANEDLFNDVQTFNIDSITRFAENQEHAALKVVEQRARKAGRLIEGEGLSFKERGVIKLHYDRFFAKMLNYVKLGKNLVFIAESKDKNETRIDSFGNQTFVKIGDMPNMQKNSEYDFDVVVICYTENGEPKGKVFRDKTGTFKPGDIIDKPNYSHWKKAVEKRQQGKKRSKEGLKDFESSINKEAEHFMAEDNKSDETELLELKIKEAQKLATMKRTKGVAMDKILKAMGSKTGSLKHVTTIEQAEEIVKNLNSF